MKQHVVWLPLMLITLVVSAALTTEAQSVYGIRANVPFDFTVGDKTIHAGKIAAQRAFSSDTAPLSISNMNKGQQVFRVARALSSSDTSDQAKLLFHKYGDRYYLAEVWIPGYKPLQLTKSNSERALERETRLAKNSKPELVTVFGDM